MSSSFKLPNSLINLNLFRAPWSWGQTGRALVAAVKEKVIHKFILPDLFTLKVGDAIFIIEVE